MPSGFWLADTKKKRSAHPPQTCAGRNVIRKGLIYYGFEIFR
jgi:hypothetical protein